MNNMNKKYHSCSISGQGLYIFGKLNEMSVIGLQEQDWVSKLYQMSQQIRAQIIFGLSYLITQVLLGNMCTSGYIINI